MGSFNVACSISSISISSGTEVVFIPLLPTRMAYGSYWDKDGIPKKDLTFNKPSSMLIYSDCYFTPFSLPIKALYNDYGGIEDVERDSNVEAIEKIFNMPIEEIVDVLAEDRDFSDSIGAIYKNYAIDKEILDNWDIVLCDDVLINLGFAQIKKQIEDVEYIYYKYNEFPYTIQLVDSKEKNAREKAYIIYNENEEIICKCESYNSKKQLFEDFYRLTNKMLNISKENQKRIELLNAMSGMFVHREIYDKLAKFNLKATSRASSYIKEDILDKLGFEKFSNKEHPLFDSHHDSVWRKKGVPYDVLVGDYGAVITHQDNKDYYSDFKKMDIEELLKAWESLTNQNVDEIKALMDNVNKPSDKDFELIQQTFKELTGISLGSHAETNRHDYIFSVFDFKKCWLKVTGDYLDIDTFESSSEYDAEYDEFRESVLKYKKETFELNNLIENCDVDDSRYPILVKGLNSLMKWENPFNKYGGRSSSFKQFYEKWFMFNELYQEPITNGLLKEDFKMYKAFYWSMYSANRFFFPAMNGEQCGNHEVSRYLYEVSHNIVDDIIKEREAEEEDDEI